MNEWSFWYQYNIPKVEDHNYKLLKKGWICYVVLYEYQTMKDVIYKYKAYTKRITINKFQDNDLLPLFSYQCVDDKMSSISNRFIRIKITYSKID